MSVKMTTTDWEKDMERNIFKYINKKNNNFVLPCVTAEAIHLPLIDLLKSISINKQQIKHYIRELKEYFNLTYYDIAIKSNFKESYIKEIVSGRRNPSRDVIVGLIFAFKLNCSEAQLFLKMAGYNELYVRDKRDLIIYKCIKEEKELKDTNQLLLQFKVAKIGNLDDDEGTID